MSDAIPLGRPIHHADPRPTPLFNSHHCERPHAPPTRHTSDESVGDAKFDVRTALYYATGVDLTALEGIDEIRALTLVSELGADFSKWPTSKHFASWLGLCPQFKKTGGKVQSSRTRLGKNRAAIARRLAAWSLIRSESYLGAYLRRQRSGGTPEPAKINRNRRTREITPHAGS